MDKRELLSRLLAGEISVEELEGGKHFNPPIFIGEKPKDYKAPAWIKKHPEFVSSILIKVAD